MTDVRTLPWRDRFRLSAEHLGPQLFFVDAFVFVMLSVGFLAGFYATHSFVNPPFGFGWVAVAFLVFIVWVAGKLVTWVAQTSMDFDESPPWRDGR